MESNQKNLQYPLSMHQLLEIAIEKKASDLHLVVGFPPAIRLNGKVTALNHPIINPSHAETLLMSLLNDKQKKELRDKLELDFSYAMEGLARFRGNIMLQRGTYAAAIRVVPFMIPEFDELGLVPEIRELCNLTSGLILVTGPTGSGKSTTLAALINMLNSTRSLNIITVEDPIEFLHKHKKSIIRQREIGIDTYSFVNALRQALRHDPDVIMVGEMRDLESISIALTAAETGHLVFSTLHTQTAPLTISRIVDIFNDEKRQQVRQQLANSLRAVISQQLIPLASGKGRAVAQEYMVGTSAIRNLIRKGSDHQLYNIIQTGYTYGMQTMDQALFKLFDQGKISRSSVFEYCTDRTEVERLMQQSIVDYSNI